MVSLLVRCAEAAPLLVSPSGHVLVEVAVAGGEPRPFVLDTGASVTTLAPDLWSGPVGRSIAIAGAGGATDASLVKEVSLSVGTTSVTLPYAVVMDVSDLGALHPDLGGVLGVDVLRQFVVALDWTAGTIDWQAVPPATPATPLRRGRGGLLLVDLALPGGVIPAVVDLGAGATVLNPLASARAGASPQGETRVGAGVDEGELGLVSIEVDACTLGGRRREPCPLTTSALPVFDVLRLSREAAAVVGVDLLGGGTLVLDAKGRRMWLD